MYRNMLSLSVKDFLILSLNKIGIKVSKKYLFSEKIYNTTLSIDRILRYEKIVQNHNKNFKLNFNNKNIVELGSGINYGWAPFAIFHGCSNYTVVEPAADYNFLNDLSNKDNYFSLYFQYLSKMFQNNITFNEFYDQCLKKIKVIKNIDDLQNEQYDYFISNSVFEHVIDLNYFINKISMLSNDYTSHFHIVDFGNHKSNTDVFNGIYNINPQKEKKIRGINYLRSSDINNLFKSNKINISQICLLNFELSNSINNYWKKYKAEDLRKGVSLFYK